MIVINIIIIWFIFGGIGALLKWINEDAVDEAFPSYMVDHSWRGPLLFFCEAYIGLRRAWNLWKGQ